MHDPRNSIGHINEDGTMELDSEIVNRIWMRGFATQHPMELGCPAQGLPKLENKVTKLEDLRPKSQKKLVTVSA